MIISIRCTFEPTQRQCYLGPSNDHPISIDDTRLGIPLSEGQTSDGWVQVEGVWKPELDAFVDGPQLIYVSIRCSHYK